MDKTPKIRNAKTTDEKVRNVLVFFRRSAALISVKEVIPPPGRFVDGHHDRPVVSAVGQPAVLEMEHPGGTLRSDRVVRHHQDGLPLVAVESHQQFENLVARPPVEIPGRLVAHQERRIVHQGAGNADPVLLTAREFPGTVFGPIGKADDFEGDGKTRRRRSRAENEVSSSGTATFRSAFSAPRRSRTGR